MVDSALFACSLITIHFSLFTIHLIVLIGLLGEGAIVIGLTLLIVLFLGLCIFSYKKSREIVNTRRALAQRSKIIQITLWLIFNKSIRFGILTFSLSMIL